MGRMKRTSKVLDKANARAAGLRAIGPFDFGNGLNTAAFDGAVSDTHTKLADYNQALSVVDDKYNALLAAEKTLQDFSERVLAGVAAKYGKNSTEYEQAGGVRKSERKRAKASKTSTDPSPSTNTK